MRAPYRMRVKAKWLLCSTAGSDPLRERKKKRWASAVRGSTRTDSSNAPAMTRTRMPILLLPPDGAGHGLIMQRADRLCDRAPDCPRRHVECPAMRFIALCVTCVVFSASGVHAADLVSGTWTTGDGASARVY